jgi:hypothetical protein
MDVLGAGTALISLFIALLLMIRPTGQIAESLRSGRGRGTGGMDEGTLLALSYAIDIFMLLVMIGYCRAMAHGGVQMFLLRSWGWALPASIAAANLCSCWTMLFAIPTGITGIIPLCQPSVRSAFD